MTPKTLEGTLEDIEGPLAETFFQLDPKTIQHADEINRNRRRTKNSSSIFNVYWTADGSVYTSENGGTLYLTRRDTNPIFRLIGEATRQLLQEGHYTVDEHDLRSVVKSPTTLEIRLSDLELKTKGDNKLWWSFEIDTAKGPTKLNPAQRLLAERVYGRENEFVNCMRMFDDKWWIKTININVLNPAYVRYSTKDKPAIALPSRLLGQYARNFNFVAGDSRFVDRPEYLRGVPIAKGDV